MEKQRRPDGAPSRGWDLAEGQTDQKYTRLSSGLPIFTTARQKPAGPCWLTRSFWGSHLSQIHTITQMSHLGISRCHIPTCPGAADWQEGDGVLLSACEQTACQGAVMSHCGQRPPTAARPGEVTIHQIFAVTSSVVRGTRNAGKGGASAHHPLEEKVDGWISCHGDCWVFHCGNPSGKMEELHFLEKSQGYWMAG